MAREHSYRVRTTWTGNLGSGTSDYRSYSRSHEILGPGKSIPIPGSADPAFRGDASRYNPEEMLIGALSACHMLWVLHLCATAGIVVTAYADDASGALQGNPDGSGQFTSITLRPKLHITDAGRAGELDDIHRKAHEFCFIARSVNFPVAIEPAAVESASH